MSDLLIYPTPLDARCELTHDTGGWTVIGMPALGPGGRPGQAFAIPHGTPDLNASQLHITAVKFLPLLQRGILSLHPEPSLRMDDFHLNPATVTLPRLVLNGDVLKQDIP